MIRYTFFINYHGDKASGLNAFTDYVEVIIKSGNPGGEPEEFLNVMLLFLRNWYDNADVTLINAEETD